MRRLPLISGPATDDYARWCGGGPLTPETAAAWWAYCEMPDAPSACPDQRVPIRPDPGGGRLEPQ